MDTAGIRSTFRTFVREDESYEAQMDGADRFVGWFHDRLGIETDDRGQKNLNPKPSFRADEFSIRGLAESLCGHEWVEQLDKSRAQSMRTARQFVPVSEAAEAIPAMVPGNLPNVSSFLGSMVGLLDAKMIEGYRQPELIADQICEVISTKTRQVKMIGLARLGDMAQRRNAGEPHKFAQVQERFSLSSATENDGLAGAVTFEAVFYDQTNELLDSIMQIGKEMAFRREFDTYKPLSGVTNPYNYRGTTYSTYLTSGNWINDQSNPFVDWTSVNVALMLGSRMTDQEQGLRVAIDYDTIICSPKKFPYIDALMSAREVEQRTQSAAFVSHAPNPMSKYRVLKSVNFDDHLTRTAANGGLALSQSNADDYWWLVKTGRGGFLVRTENWPLTIEQATPDSYTMKNHRMLLAVFADQNYAIDVRDPRYVIRNKN